MSGDFTRQEDLWSPLNAFFSQFLRRLRAHNDKLWAQIGHHESATFPFTGYLSMNRDGAGGGESLVLTWAVERRDHLLRIAADIARGDGTVLAEIPAVDLRQPVSHTQLADQLTQAIHFFGEHFDLVEREVC